MQRNFFYDTDTTQAHSEKNGLDTYLTISVLKEILRELR